MIVCVEYLNLQACIFDMCIQWYVLQSGEQIQTHMLCNKFVCVSQEVVVPQDHTFRVDSHFSFP